MSFENWTRRASGLLLPGAERDLACKFRFGVTDSASGQCCANPDPVCGCEDGEVPEYLIIYISNAPVLTIGNSTLNINGTFKVYRYGSTGCLYFPEYMSTFSRRPTVTNDFIPSECFSVRIINKVVEVSFYLSSNHYNTLLSFTNPEIAEQYCWYSYTWKKIYSGSVPCNSLNKTQIPEDHFTGFASGIQCKVTASSSGTVTDLRYRSSACGIASRPPGYPTGPNYISIIIKGQEYILAREFASINNPGEPQWVYYGPCGVEGSYADLILTGSCWTADTPDAYVFGIYSRNASKPSDWWTEYTLQNSGHNIDPAQGMCNLNITDTVVRVIGHYMSSTVWDGNEIRIQAIV